MNAFANTLFTLLFGWIRAGVQAIWGSVTQGRLSSFFTWLGDHWFMVLVILCAVCTVLDYLVWLVRWRPYLVWRTKMRKFLSALRGRKWAEERQFTRGYVAGVQMDDLPPPEPIPEPPILYPEEPVYAPPPTWEPAAPQADYVPAPPAPAPLFQAAQDMPPAEEPLAPEADQPPARRRRSERYAHPQQSPRWHEKLLNDPYDNMNQEGLPPAVDQDEAFHAPVYPAYPDSNYAAWQGSPDRQQPNGQGSP